MSTTPEDPQQPGGQVPPAQGYQAPPSAAGYGAPAAQPQLSDSDQRTWATLGHAGGIILGFIAPLIVWLVQKGKGAYVEDQAKEALNFQIVMLIGYIVANILFGVTGGLLFFLPGIVWVVNLVFCIIAAMAANKGEPYRYPFNLRLVK